MLEVIAIGKFMVLILSLAMLLSYSVLAINREVDGVKHWFIASVFLFSHGFLLAMLAECNLSIPSPLFEIVHYLITNISLIIGTTYLATGFERFFNYKSSFEKYRWSFIFLALTLLVIFSYVHSSMLARMWVLRVMTITPTLLAIFSLYSHNAKKYYLSRYLAITVLTFAIVLLALGLVIPTDGISPTANNPKLLLLAYINLSITHFTLIFCSALMCTEKKNLQLEKMSQTDPLTEALNRRGWEAMTAASIGNQCHSVIVFDLDFFKRLNDQYGHAAGDAALTVVAKLTMDNLPQTAALGRLGGEEFAIYLPDSDKVIALKLAELLRSNISQHKIIFDNTSIQLTASFGVFSATQAMRIAQMLQYADEALYIAKQQGRNQVKSSQTDSKITTSTTLNAA